MQLMAAWILPFPASEAEIASNAQDVTCRGGQTFLAAAVIWSDICDGGGNSSGCVFCTAGCFCRRRGAS